MFGSRFERLANKIVAEFPDRVESVSQETSYSRRGNLVIAQFTDDHDEPYSYQGISMPTGGLFILKIFSEKNIAVYDKNKNIWQQIIYARSFREHWKIVG